MDNPMIDNTPLTPKAPRVVGRETELALLRDCLHQRGERHYVYVWGMGGLGKTRLLEELQDMVAQAGPKFQTTGIIDLYHTDLHGTSDVERAIVEGLDPNKKFFSRYRDGRAKYELVRERGADPAALEKQREQLAGLFVDECREMAHDVRKIVICFDTVEILQYESSVVEELAGPHTVDTRIRAWLLDKLSQLANVLVVFAGRPKPHSSDETVDHQARLVQDMAQAFGENLIVHELKPFDLAETGEFVQELTGHAEVIPRGLLPVIHRLTEGRPIYLHLIVDLVQGLSSQPRAVLDRLGQYVDLATAPHGDPSLEQARLQIQTEILKAVFNEAAELGSYLGLLALMPKGANVEILQQGLGLPQGEAVDLLNRLAPLSFIKRYKALPGPRVVHGDRLFLHDEMYQLLRLPGIVPNVRIKERQVAHALVSDYYDPRIKALDVELNQLPVEKRVPVREELQKLQVERLYYVLAHDAAKGYADYKRLSDEANRKRLVGHGMRLLDEFLRFYNAPGRRDLFKAAGVMHEQVVRESAMMWVERFYWWGQLDRLEQFAQQLTERPEALHIRPDDTALLGDVYARWVDGAGMRKGHNPELVAQAELLLGRLPPITNGDPDHVLARARLCTSIGYQYRLGGLLDKAVKYYKEANAGFRQSTRYPDELAMLLNNLAYVYARQGRMEMGVPLANEALRISRSMGKDYSTGLTLSTLAAVDSIRGHYPQAVDYGQEALDLFRGLGDPHGIALAYRSIAYAMRKMAKRDIEKGWKLDDARQRLEDTVNMLNSAIQQAEAAELESDLPELYAEQGKAKRELGRLVAETESLPKGLPFYHESEDMLKKALDTQVGLVERADILQDLAETLFNAHNAEEANKRLKQVEDILPSATMAQTVGERLPSQYYWPLGKAERLRGMMAFTQNQPESALQHFVLAYVYFVRFSPDALEKDALVDSLYTHLVTLPAKRQRELIESTRAWVESQGLPEADTNSFISIIADLVGT